MAKRLFLALTPDPETVLAIERWRVMNWPTLERAVPAQNYHLTLCFLGDASADQQRVVESGMIELLNAPIDVTLDEVGYWPDQEILFLGGNSESLEMDKVSQACIALAGHAGLKVRRGKFVPHITLARRCVNPPGPLVSPDFSFRADAVSLYASILDRAGARYIEQTRIEC